MFIDSGENMPLKLKTIIVFAAILSLQACSTVPRTKMSESLQTAPANNLQLAEVRNKPELYFDTLVRWGGDVLKSEVVKADNGSDLIRIEVLQRKLNKKARPQSSSDSDGRFVAYLPKPENITGSLKDHLITIKGKVSSTESMPLGKDNVVTLPVLESNDFYVWHRNNHEYEHDRHHTNWRFGIELGAGLLWYGHHFFNNGFYYRHEHYHHQHGPFYRH